MSNTSNRNDTGIRDRSVEDRSSTDNEGVAGSRFLGLLGRDEPWVI
jgi:hypothetical protein